MSHCNNGLNNHLVNNLIETKVAKETGDLKYLQDSMREFIAALSDLITGKYSDHFLEEYVGNLFTDYQDTLEESLKIPQLKEEVTLALQRLSAQDKTVKQHTTQLSQLFGDVSKLENTNLVLESVADLSTIKKPVDGMRVYVKSYHSGMNLGGGFFTWSAQTKKELADGGLIIDPSSLNNYTGQSSLVSNLYDSVLGQGSGEGSGCFIRSTSQTLSIFDYGGLPERGTTDIGLIATSMSRLGVTDIYIPEGEYSMNRQIRLKSHTYLHGAGRDKTILYAEDEFTNDPYTSDLIISDNYTGQEHNNLLEEIHLRDFTLDGRAWERAGKVLTLRTNIHLSAVKNSSIKRVRSINGAQHCIDVLASELQGSTGVHNQPQGMSENVLIEDCIAENPRGDDPITIHNSKHITLNRCTAFYDRELHGLPTHILNGIEVDEGCINVTVKECRSIGGAKGFQAKSHGNATHPAFIVSFENCVAEQVGTGFDLGGAGNNVNQPIVDGIPTKHMDVRLLNCTVRGIHHTKFYLNAAERESGNPPTHNEYPTCLVNFYGYRNVVVNNLTIEDCSVGFNIANNCETIYVDGLNIFCSIPSMADRGLFNISSATKNIKSFTLKNVISNFPQVNRLVSISRGGVTTTIENVIYPSASEGHHTNVNAPLFIAQHQNPDINIKNIKAEGWDFAWAFLKHGYGGEMGGDYTFWFDNGIVYRRFESLDDLEQASCAAGERAIVGRANIGSYEYVAIRGTVAKPSTGLNSWSNISSYGSQTLMSLLGGLNIFPDSGKEFTTGNRFISLDVYEILAGLIRMPITVSFDIQSTKANTDIRVYPYQDAGITITNEVNINNSAVGVWERKVLHTYVQDLGYITGRTEGSIGLYAEDSANTFKIKNVKIELGHTGGVYTPSLKEIISKLPENV